MESEDLPRRSEALKHKNHDRADDKEDAAQVAEKENNRKNRRILTLY